MLLKNIDIKAILVGSITDLIGTSLFGMLFNSLVKIRLTARGLAPKEIQDQISKWSSDTDGFFYILFFGLSFTFLGGYLAARISRTETLINSMLVGVFAIFTSLPFIRQEEPITLFVSLLLMIPVSTAGGYHYLKQWTSVKNNDNSSDDDQDQE